MGNEIEIKDLDVRSTSFLPTEIKDIDSITDIYSLEDEFAKTKKNRNIGLYSAIGLFFLLVIGAAIAFSIYIQQRNQQVEINISEFEDLRLKEVIDSARSHENNLDLLLIKKEILEVEHRKKVLEVQRKYHQRELDLLARSLPEKQTDVRLAGLRQAERQEISKVNASFEEELQVKEEEIERIKQELAEKKAAEESGQAEAISNVDRLNKLKMEQLKESNDSGVVALREYYENYVEYLTNVYNPPFKSRRLQSIINSASNYDVKTTNGYHPVLQQEGVTSYSNYAQLQQKKENNQSVLNRIQRIPYRGSVAPALSAVSTITQSISSDYENLLARSANVMRYKNGIIENYRNAIDLFLADKSESGYIINADDEKSIHIQLNDIYKDYADQTALVFRSDDEYIGKIRISQMGYDGILRARVVERVKSKPFKPFDKILLEIN